MATPLSEQHQQSNLVELVDTGNSSMSGDESYSSLSNVEHSGSCRIEQDDMKGEVISQRFIVKQETENNDDCHRTPLTVSIDSSKLYLKNTWSCIEVLIVDCIVSLFQTLMVEPGIHQP